MKKRYFRKADPRNPDRQDQWLEMTGQEFYRFVRSPEGQRRHFIDMGNVVLEVSEAEAKVYRAECNHRYYLQEQEDGWSTVSLYALLDSVGRSGEDRLADEAAIIEETIFLQLELHQLRTALEALDTDSYDLIYTLYLAEKPKSLRQLSRESGIPVMTLQDRKKRVLQRLREVIS